MHHNLPVDSCQKTGKTEKLGEKWGMNQGRKMDFSCSSFRVGCGKCWYLRCSKSKLLNKAAFRNEEIKIALLIIFLGGLFTGDFPFFNEQVNIQTCHILLKLDFP